MRLKSTSLLAEAPGVTDSRGYHAPGGHGGETHMPVGIYRWRRKGNLRNLAQTLKVSMACRNMHFHFSSPSLHLSLPFHPTCSLFSLFLQPLHAIPAHPSVSAVITLASSSSLDTPLPSKPQSSLQQSQPPLSASDFRLLSSSSLPASSSKCWSAFFISVLSCWVTLSFLYFKTQLLPVQA